MSASATQGSHNNVQAMGRLIFDKSNFTGYIFLDVRFFVVINLVGYFFFTGPEEVANETIFSGQ